MSMHYPPASQPGFDENGGLVLDELPPQGAYAVPSARLVHLDIDPSNCECNSPSLSLFPVGVFHECYYFGSKANDS